MEGLSATNRLLDAAKKNMPDCIIRDKLYRIALTEKNALQLKLTAELHPEFAKWIDPGPLEEQTGTASLGGILLSNGCQVIHVPSYLKGLWNACEELYPDKTHWSIDESDSIDWKEKLADFDSVVFSAGSGLFHDCILCKEPSDFSVELVRGQSVEMMLDDDHKADHPNEPILCGKYILPMSKPNQILIGATHEYLSESFDKEQVIEELKSRSYDISPFVWDNGTVTRITSGYRVQSRRGPLGRMPIIGKHCGVHDNAYLFTGLSARGLMYHGIYGDILSSIIVAKDEKVIMDEYPDLIWWK